MNGGPFTGRRCDQAALTSEEEEWRRSLEEAWARAGAAEREAELLRERLARRTTGPAAPADAAGWVRFGGGARRSGAG